MARLTQILEAMQAHLSENLSTSYIPSMQKDRINLIARNEVPALVGESDVQLRVRGFTADPAHASRHDMRVSRTVDVTIRVRLVLDKVGSDWAWFKKVFEPFELATINALQLFEPTDDQGNNLMVQPMRIVRGDTATKDNKIGDAFSWGQTSLACEVVYAVDVDPTII